MKISSVTYGLITSHIVILVLAISQVHKIIPQSPNVGEEYGWELPGYIFLFVTFPAITAYFAGRKDEQTKI